MGLAYLLWSSSYLRRQAERSESGSAEERNSAEEGTQGRGLSIGGMRIVGRLRPPRHLLLRGCVCICRRCGARCPKQRNGPCAPLRCF